jgi:hypothetical protein
MVKTRGASHPGVGLAVDLDQTLPALGLTPDVTATSVVFITCTGGNLRPELWPLAGKDTAGISAFEPSVEIW